MSKDIFKKPLTVFQQNVNDIMNSDKSKDLVEDLIHLQMFKNAEKDEKQLVLVELYNLLGTEKFMEVMDLLAGKTIKFPQKDDFKETIQIALCYYYKQVKNYDWEEIKNLINDEDLQSVKYGIRVQQLQCFINYYGELRMSHLNHEKDNNNDGK